MNFLFRTICLLLFFFTLASYSQNKEKSLKKSDIPIEVKVNILVVNPSDILVNDLNQEDFKIYEDGVEQKITYFAKKEPTLNLALVFDNSGSLRPYLNEIIQAGKIITANLRDSDEAFVVRFASSDSIEVIQDYTNDKNKLKGAIDNLFVQSGQTAVLDAVYLSAEKLLERAQKDNSKRYAIVLFSDAEERDSYYKLGQVMQMLKGKDLPIFLLSYAESAPQTKKIAKSLSRILPTRTGGTEYLLPKNHKSDDVVNILKSVIYELRSQYIVGYTSTNQLLDETPRKITVQISDGKNSEKRRGFLRESYTIPTNNKGYNE